MQLWFFNKDKVTGCKLIGDNKTGVRRTCDDQLESIFVIIIDNSIACRRSLDEKYTTGRNITSTKNAISRSDDQIEKIARTFLNSFRYRTWQDRLSYYHYHHHYDTKIKLSQSSAQCRVEWATLNFKLNRNLEINLYSWRMMSKELWPLSPSAARKTV